MKKIIFLSLGILGLFGGSIINTQKVVGSNTTIQEEESQENIVALGADKQLPSRPGLNAVFVFLVLVGGGIILISTDMFASIGIFMMFLSVVIGISFLHYITPVLPKEHCHYKVSTGEAKDRTRCGKLDIKINADKHDIKGIFKKEGIENAELVSRLVDSLTTSESIRLEQKGKDFKISLHFNDSVEYKEQKNGSFNIQFKDIVEEEIFNGAGQGSVFKEMANELIKKEIRKTPIKINYTNGVLNYSFNLNFTFNDA